MLHCRVSHLEAFRRAVETEFGSEQELADTLAGNPPPPNERMERGTALHRCVEGDEDVHYSTEQGGQVQSGAFLFWTDDVNAIKGILGKGRHEVTGYSVYETAFGPLEVEGTADHLSGLVVSDLKTKFTPVDPDDYQDSLQWRFYLSIHGCDVFRYVCAEMTEPDESGLMRLKGIETWRLWRPVTLGSEVTGWCERFAAWCQAKGLTKYMGERRVRESDGAARGKR